MPSHARKDIVRQGEIGTSRWFSSVRLLVGSRFLCGFWPVLKHHRQVVVTYSSARMKTMFGGTVACAARLGPAGQTKAPSKTSIHRVRWVDASGG